MKGMYVWAHGWLAHRLRQGDKKSLLLSDHNQYVLSVTKSSSPSHPLSNHQAFTSHSLRFVASAEEKTVLLLLFTSLEIFFELILSCLCYFYDGFSQLFFLLLIDTRRNICSGQRQTATLQSMNAYVYILFLCSPCLCVKRKHHKRIAHKGTGWTDKVCRGGKTNANEWKTNRPKRKKLKGEQEASIDMKSSNNSSSNSVHTHTLST